MQIVLCCLIKIPLPALRRQDEKNRQNSIDDLDPFDVQNLELQMQTLFDSSMSSYTNRCRTWRCKGMWSHGTPTLHAHQNLHDWFLRSWIHYITLRSANGTQQEHMDIALECKEVFKEQFPVVAEELEW